MASAMCNKVSMRTSSRPTMARKPARATVVKTRASLDPSIIVSGSTLAFLSLGRFVFLPYQRKNADDSRLAPKTTGNTYFNNLSKPANFTMTSNDPSGFTIIDVFGWGALGHAFAYLILATSSLHDYGVTPWPVV